MQEQTIQITVQRQKLATLADCVALLEWSTLQEGLTVTVTARVDGDIYVQAEGVTVPTVRATLGDTITWDGNVFTVEAGE